MTIHIKFALPLALLTLSGPSLGACAQARDNPPEVVTMPSPTLIRTPFETTEFQPFIPGAALHYIYGGMGLGVPTAQVATMEPGFTIAMHYHTNDYYAVVVSGNYQHWEDGEPDQGPVMTAGSTFFQGGGALHYDACLGPESCVLYVYFPVSADAIFPSAQ